MCPIVEATVIGVGVLVDAAGWVFVGGIVIDVAQSTAPNALPQHTWQFILLSAMLGLILYKQPYTKICYWNNIMYMYVHVLLMYNNYAQQTAL